MKIALFLVGLLIDISDEKASAKERTQKNWARMLEEYEETLPEPGERTVEQWEKLLELRAEAYYALAAMSEAASLVTRLHDLRDGLREAMEL